LENGFHTYARILKNDFAFYDSRTNKELTLEEIVKKPVLFILTVHDSAVTKGYWVKIGKILPIEPHLLIDIPVFTQNILNPLHFTIYFNGKTQPATQEECKGMEYFMIWTHTDVEKRLNDYYSDRKNEYTEQIKNADMYSWLYRKVRETHKI